MSSFDKPSVKEAASWMDLSWLRTLSKSSSSLAVISWYSSVRVGGEDEKEDEDRGWEDGCEEGVEINESVVMVEVRVWVGR